MSRTDPFTYLHNPANQDSIEFIENFVVRGVEFRDLYADIRTSSMMRPEQHYIIAGSPGSGKTSFLLRTYYEVQRDSNINGWLIPILFSEEEYRIHSLRDLWSTTLHYMLESNEFTEYSRYRLSQDDVIELDVILSYLKAKSKRLLLLVDNIGMILERLSDHERRQMREILLTSEHIRVIGSSVWVLEHTYDYSQPFFDFFKYMHLEELSFDDTVHLLNHLNQSHGNEDIARKIKRSRGRIETVRRLAGGIPRNIKFFFGLLANDTYKDTFRDMEKILDQVTPLYKQRMENLTPNRQLIMDTLARSWDPLSESALRAQAGAASEEDINFLKRARLIICEPDENGTEYCQIFDRFFNIWYLMRYDSTRSKDRVLWLSKFLESWYTDEELTERIDHHFQSLEEETYSSKYTRMMSDALEALDSPRLTSGELLPMIEKTLEKGADNILREEAAGSPLVGMGAADRDIFYESVILYVKKDFRGSVNRLLEMKGKNETVMHHIAYVYQFGLNEYAEAEKYYNKAFEKGSKFAMNDLGLMLYYKVKNVDGAEAVFRKAAAQGDERAYNNLGNIYMNDRSDYHMAEECYVKAIKAGYLYAFRNLGILYQYRYRDHRTAEKYYLAAAKAGSSRAMNNLGNIYAFDDGDFDKAEELYLMAIARDDISALNNLACLYTFDKVDLEKAEEYYLKALERGHKDVLGNLSRFYLRRMPRKGRALDYAKKFFKETPGPRSRLLYAVILLWHRNFEEGVSLVESRIDSLVRDESCYSDLRFFLIFMIARNRSNELRALFRRAPTLVDMYQPVYFAFRCELEKSISHQQIRRELRTSVDDVIREVVTLRFSYK